MPTDHHSAPNPFRLGWQAARTNALPGLLIVIIALGVLIGYHRWPAFHDALEVVSDWKERFGFTFSAISTAIFGGLLPVFFRLIPPETRKDPQFRHLPFFLIFWAYKGIEVDALYHIQARIFGDSNDISVVIPKILIDQLVYVPFLALPGMLLAYLWKDCGYSFAETRRQITRRWFFESAIPILIANWGVWIPAVAIIYNLPMTLQLPLQNLILCLFVLLIMILTNRSAGIPARDRDGTAPSEAH